jgi:hypothetical protein
VQREWRNIDLFIELRDIRLIFIIELKVNALEHGDQLRCYSDSAEERWPSTGPTPWRKLFLYLTPRGLAPSEEGWSAISYDVVTNAIDAVLERQVTKEPLARSMLEAYAAMLRRHHMEDKDMIRRAEKLWQSHGEALEFVMRHRPDRKRRLRQLIVENIAEVASIAREDGIVLERDSDDDDQVLFLVKGWDDYAAMKTGERWTRSRRLVLVLIDFRSTEANLVMGPGPAAIRTEICASLGWSKKEKPLSEKDWPHFATRKLLERIDFGEHFDEAHVFMTLKEQFRRFIKEEIGPLDGQMKTVLARLSQQVANG